MAPRTRQTNFLNSIFENLRSNLVFAFANNLCQKLPFYCPGSLVFMSIKWEGDLHNRVKSVFPAVISVSDVSSNSLEFVGPRKPGKSNDVRYELIGLKLSKYLRN